jgi:hypothetical protein
MAKRGSMPQLVPEEPKSRVRIRAPKDPDDKFYEPMATMPNLVRQDWFDDPSKLPKRPPGKR